MSKVIILLFSFILVKAVFGFGVDQSISPNNRLFLSPGTSLELSPSTQINANNNFHITNGFGLRLNDTGANYVEFQSPSVLASSLVFTLPSIDGATDQCLRTNGSGVLTFGECSNYTPTLDNSVLRADTTGGSVQESSVIIDDSDNITGITDLTAEKLSAVSTTKSSHPCPTMTTTQRDLLTPATGDCVDNSTTAQFERYNGTIWEALGGGGSALTYQYIKYDTRAGFGSSATEDMIPHYTNTTYSSGSGIFTAANSTVNGATVTLDADAYCVSTVGEAHTGTGEAYGISNNATDRGAAGGFLAASHTIKRVLGHGEAGQPSSATMPLGFFSSGDVLRPHSNNPVNLGTTTLWYWEVLCYN